MEIKFKIAENKIEPLREHLKKLLESELKATEYINDLNIYKLASLFNFGHIHGVLESYHTIMLLKELLKEDPEADENNEDKDWVKGFWLYETYREMYRDVLHTSNIPKNDYERAKHKAKLLLLDELKDYFEIKC
jgi:hypothetical protein